MNPEHRYLQPFIRRLKPDIVLRYAESRGWKRIDVDADASFWLLEHPDYHLRQLQIPMDDDPGFVDAMTDMVGRLAERNCSFDKLVDELLAASFSVCGTCGGFPNSHPSGIPCVCEDGTREGEIIGLRKAVIKAEERAHKAEQERDNLRNSIDQIRKEIRESTDILKTISKDIRNNFGRPSWEGPR